MKYILSFFLTLSVLCTSLSAVEYGFISNHATNNITLQEGDIFEVLSFSAADNNYMHLRVLKIDADLTSTSDGDLLYNQPFGYIRDWASLPTFCGPSKVTVWTDSTGRIATVFYKLTRASEVEYKNVNIISLPASTVGAGTHEIVVEASDDLQTWTPVHSSSIGGNKAFFRTRVVEAGD